MTARSASSFLFRRATLAACGDAAGAVVVIDVLRAFTSTAYALAAGARDVLLTSTVEEAFELRRRFPGSLLMGEVDGLKVDGFDFGNSPVDLAGADLAGRRMIQRTGHGTQGVVRSRMAELLLATGFTTAQATVNALLRANHRSVTFVITGALDDETFAGGSLCQGDEDAACADYLESLLSGQNPDPVPYLERVRQAPAANKFLDPEQVDFSSHDLELCMRVDVFDFAMPVIREDNLWVLTGQYTA